MSAGNPVLRQGWLQKFSKGLMGEKWKRVYVMLYKDSSLFWFKNQGDATSKGNVMLKTVCNFLAVGAYVRAIPYSPELPPGAKIDHVLAIPQEPHRKAKVNWFLAETDQELEQWMKAITSTLPEPPKQPATTTTPTQPSSAPYNPPSATAPTAPPPQATPYPNSAPYQAPPAAAPRPTGGLGFDAVAGQPPPYSPSGYAAHPAQPYPQQPYPQQPYPQQQHYRQQPYPQQQYVQQQGLYPQQVPNISTFTYGPRHPVPGYPTQPPGGYAPPPAPAQGYPAPPPGGYHPQHVPPHQAYQGQFHQGGMGYHQQMAPATQTVIVKEKKKTKGMGKMAAGLVGGAAAGYMAGRMMGGGGYGGGWGGGWGWGGSWSSHSWSAGSFGGGSFGSFGSFD